MKNSYRSEGWTLLSLYAFSAILAALVFVAPRFFKWYFYRYPHHEPVYIAVLVVVYLAIPLAACTLYNLICLLRRIRRGEVFCRENVSCIRAVSIFMFLAGMLFFAGGFFYLPFFILSIAAMFVMLIVRVVKNCFASAVLLKEENDATI